MCRLLRATVPAIVLNCMMSSKLYNRWRVWMSGVRFKVPWSDAWSGCTAPQAGCMFQRKANRTSTQPMHGSTQWRAVQHRDQPHPACWPTYRPITCRETNQIALRHSAAATLCRLVRPHAYWLLRAVLTQCTGDCSVGRAPQPLSLAARPQVQISY